MRMAGVSTIGPSSVRVTAWGPAGVGVSSRVLLWSATVASWIAWITRLGSGWIALTRGSALSLRVVGWIALARRHPWGNSCTARQSGVMWLLSAG